MIATGSHEPERTPQALWLIRTGIYTAAALSAALIGVLWVMFFTTETTTPGALAGLVCGTLAALAGGFLIRQVIRDLAEREKRAARDAGHDLLSGLANRKLFAQWVDYELARHRREKVHFAVMYFDIDHFKDINDRHGHDAGDRMIMAVSQRIAETLRPTDRLARFGGDEFAILQTGVRTMRDAEALANRILDAMRRSFAIGRLDVTSSVSIGIALCPDNASERDDLMKLADLALYRAKKEGRNRFAFFDARMGEDLTRRRIFGLELAEAIEKDRLTLDYQPVFAPGKPQPVGAEARLRWPHPQRGLIKAKDFMNIAEERGLLLPLGEWVLKNACKAAQKWDGVRLSVHLSPVQFNHRDFAAQCLQILHDADFDPTRLDLCIDEECLMEPKDDAIAGMKMLRREGVRFTLAHFGAGLASLNYIRRFPFNRIKLDERCVEISSSTTDNAAVLHAEIHLGRALGFTMAADGVETEEQARYLTALGCDEMQGRLFCRYVSVDEIQQMIAPAGRS